MNRSERISYPVAEALGEALGAAWLKLGRAWNAYVEARAHAAAIRELERLDDRILKDIGLHRSAIREAVHKSRLPWS